MEKIEIHTLLEKIFQKEIPSTQLIAHIGSACVRFSAGELQDHKNGIQKVARLCLDWLKKN
jgi:hypothetical protein